MALIKQIGSTGAGTSSSNISTNVKSVSRFTIGADVDITHLCFRVSATTYYTLVKGVIYADSAGLPGALVFQTPFVGAGAVVGTCAVPLGQSLHLAAGTYWLGIYVQTNMISIYCVASTGTNKYNINSQSWDLGPTDPFGTTSNFSHQFDVWGALEDTPSIRIPKSLGYAVVGAPPTSLSVTKAVGYAAVSNNFAVSKVVAYSVVRPPGFSISKASIYSVVIRKPEQFYTYSFVGGANDSTGSSYFSAGACTVTKYTLASPVTFDTIAIRGSGTYPYDGVTIPMARGMVYTDSASTSNYHTLSHRYWRYYITTTPNGSYAGFTETELHSAIGGSDLTGSGTALASTSYTGINAGMAVDNDTASRWSSTAGMPQWWGYDFGTPVNIVEFTITARTDSINYNQAPGTFYLEASDNGTDWCRIAGWSGITFTSGQTRTFTVADNLTSAPATLVTSAECNLPYTTTSVGGTSTFPMRLSEGPRTLPAGDYWLGLHLNHRIYVNLNTVGSNNSYTVTWSDGAPAVFTYSGSTTTNGAKEDVLLLLTDKKWARVVGEMIPEAGQPNAALGVTLNRIYATQFRANEPSLVQYPVTAVAFESRYPYPSAKIRWAVYDSNKDLIGSTDELVGINQGVNVVPLTANVTLVSNSLYYIAMVSDTTLSFASTGSYYYTASFNYSAYTYGPLPSTAPSSFTATSAYARVGLVSGEVTSDGAVDNLAATLIVTDTTTENSSLEDSANIAGQASLAQDDAEIQASEVDVLEVGTFLGTDAVLQQETIEDSANAVGQGTILGTDAVLYDESFATNGVSQLTSEDVYTMFTGVYPDSISATGRGSLTTNDGYAWTVPFNTIARLSFATSDAAIRDEQFRTRDRGRLAATDVKTAYSGVSVADSAAPIGRATFATTEIKIHTDPLAIKGCSRAPSPSTTQEMYIGLSIGERGRMTSKNGLGQTVTFRVRARNIYGLGPLSAPMTYYLWDTIIPQSDMMVSTGRFQTTIDDTYTEAPPAPLGFTWENLSAPYSQLEEITYNGTSYLAMEVDTLRFMASLDGVTWTKAGDMPPPFSYNACSRLLWDASRSRWVAFINGAGTIMKCYASEDAQNWTLLNADIFPADTVGGKAFQYINDAAYGNGVLVAVGQRNVAYTDPAADYDTPICYSTDGGTTWIKATVAALRCRAAASRAVRVKYDNGVFLVGCDGDRATTDSAYVPVQIIYSTNGVDWTRSYLPNPPWVNGGNPLGKVRDFAWGSDQWICTTWYDIWRSTDNGVTWTRVTPTKPFGGFLTPTGYYIYSNHSVIWNGSEFVVYDEAIQSPEPYSQSNTYYDGSAGSTITYSSNGTDWTIITDEVDDRFLYCLESNYLSFFWLGGKCIATGFMDILWDSPDGITWTDHSNGRSADNESNPLWTGTAWITQHAWGNIARGTAPENMEVAFYGPSGNIFQRFVKVGSTIIASNGGGSDIARSRDDGQNWSWMPYPDEPNFSGWGWDLGLAGHDGNWYIHANGGGGIVSTDDGDTWNFVQSNLDFDAKYMIWDGTQYVAVGGFTDDNDGLYKACILTCTVPGTWTIRWSDIPAGSRVPTWIAYNGTMYMVVGFRKGTPDQPYVLRSLNSIDWIATNIGEQIADEWMESVAWGEKGGPTGEDVWMASGYDGVHWSTDNGATWTYYRFSNDDNAGNMYGINFNGNHWLVVGEMGRVFKGTPPVVLS